MTRSEKTKAIRQELKRRYGWTSRQVSVRGQPCTYSGSIDVTIKDPSVPLPLVEAVANQYKSVRRCEYSGDILQGGNTYVTVEYDRELIERLATPVVEAASDEPGVSVEVGAGYSICRVNDRYKPDTQEYFWFHGDDPNNGKHAWNKHCAAEGLVIHRLSYPDGEPTTEPEAEPEPETKSGPVEFQVKPPRGLFLGPHGVG